MTALACAPATRAFAQEGAPEPGPRTFGGGVSFGVGLQSWNDYDHGAGYRPVAIGASLGTLELMFFADDHLSLDLSLATWVPVLDVVETGAGAYTATAYLDWSFGDRTRFVVGPGLGASGHTASPRGSTLTLAGAAGAQLRIAGLVGLEIVSAGRMFGFRLVTRPWLSIGGGDAGLQLGGGALLEAIVMAYAL